MASTVEQPNILILVTHDTGRHLGCYGTATAATPNLEQLASEGVLFANHFATASTCSPSRGSIFTGRYPHSNGLMGLANGGWGWRLHKGEKHMARLLADAGYETALAGSHHEIDGTQTDDAIGELGYQQTLPRGTSPHLPASGAPVLDWLREPDRGSDRPFFLCIGTFETHRPFNQPDDEPDDPDSVWVPPYLPDEPGVREDIAAFHGRAKAADAFVGEIMKTLDETGLADNTLLVYTTDHGIPYPRAKGTLYGAGIETALIMRGPGGFSGGQAREELTSNVDLLPTILDLVGASVPANIQGRSFLPLVRGEPYEDRDAIFAETTYLAEYDPTYCVRTARYSYLLNLAPEKPMFLGDLAVVPRESRTPYAIHLDGRPEEELYDLEADPYEGVNLADSADHAFALEEMRDRLARWREETDDPALAGQPPAPPCFAAISESLLHQQRERPRQPADLT